MRWSADSNIKRKESNIKTWSIDSIKDKIRGENNPEHKLKNKDVIFIYIEGCKRRDFITKYGPYKKYSGYNYSEIAAMFNISLTMVRYITNGRLWSHITSNIDINI